MKSFQVKISQQGATRSIRVKAKSSIDALLAVSKTINHHMPSRVFVRASA